MQLKELIQEAKKGSRAAEKALFDHFESKYLLLCIRYVKNEHDAQERLLDGFYKFFRSLPGFQYQSDAALYACLTRIMVNECVMQLRKKRVFDIVAEPLETDIIVNEDHLDKIAAAEIHAMITKLPAGPRTVFNLYAIEGYRHDEIGQIMGITASTSRAHLTKARAMLQRSLSFLKGDYENGQSK